MGVLLAVIVYLVVRQVTAYKQLVQKGLTIATSSTTFETFEASHAVDKNFSQDIKHCSHTDNLCNIKEAWLRIDLTKVYSIASVKFWYRKDYNQHIKRLPGYSILFSNESWPNSSCYRNQNNSDLKTVNTNECRATTQYLWFYQPYKPNNDCAPILEICEVEVFGCDVGFYGENCSKTCGLCKSGSCDIVNGQCDKLGCALPRFQTPGCKDCLHGFYGENCSRTCSEFCKNNICDQTSGTCLEGCLKGYIGEDCNKTCPSGNYGKKCFETCGNCSLNLTCNHINGTCNDGCVKGLTGLFCKTECANKTYGENCSNTCGRCRNSVACNNINGTCPDGCDPGWQSTDKCDVACRNGTYGKDCLKNCSGNCLDNLPCNKKSGMCVQCIPGWINGFCTEKHVPSKPFDTYEGLNPIFVIAPSASFVAVLFILVVVLFVILRRRQNKPSKRKDDVSHQEIINLDDDPDTVLKSNTTKNEYSNTGNSTYIGIDVSKLIDTIHCLERDSDTGFLKEFQSIPYGEQPDKSCTVGKLPENIPKNRFKTTFPYDHSRIILRYEEKTKDYINANFIKNTYRQPAYIAAQGPILSTIEDFWQMVWQEDVYVIAMVTNLSEGGTIKCAKYWPDNTGGYIKVDIFGIQLDSEKTYSSFLIHQLQLTNLKTKASRQITHLQYTAWPDHGTPDSLDLLVYHQYVTRAMKEHSEHRLLVHCSAGIGRTGTFIALDALYRHGVKEGSINIVEYVHTMREDRMSMIQNPDQYKFLYRALYESFRAKINPLSKENFLDEVGSVLSSDKAVNLSNLRIQFKELDSLKPVFQENEKSSGYENMSLNMTGSVLPADRIRIILSPHVKDRGTYYNAVPVSTFTMRDCIITGQYPVPGAAVDLIRLLVDQECSTLISTSPLSEVPSSREWFCPSPRGKMIFQYQVQVDKGVRVTDYVIKSTIRIKAPAASDWQDVTLYEMTTWNTNDKLPQDSRPILDVVSLLHLNENVDAENKIAILSRDGASRCGVFCAVYNAILQLQQDQEVNMFTIVRQLQSRRPEMISDFEEFMFSCQAVFQFIKQNPDEVYINYNQALVGGNIYANT